MIRVKRPFARVTWTILIGLATVFLSCSTPPSTWTHWDAPASIRSLDVLNDHHARYAGSDGWVGQTSGQEWEHRQWVAPDSSLPSFRSSSFSGDAWFAVGISSPAWIAKTSSHGWEPQWVHHDTSSKAFLDAMAWWNEEEGLVFGDPLNGCLTLLRTSDGGDTWTQVSCDSIPSHADGEAGFAASNGNICIQGDTAWVFTGGVSSRCLRSFNRGQTWEAIELPIRQGESMTGVFGASFSSSQHGIAIGGHWEHPEDNRGNLIRTQDGGSSWSLIAEGSGPGYRSCIVHHPTQSNALVATGFLGVDVSLDGGQTWEHISDSSRFVARFSPSGRTLWLAGKRTLSRVDWPLPPANH